jgi:Flp pilus assembly protein TadD
VDEDGENSAYHDSLGWTHLRMNDPARAIKAFDRAIALKAESPWSTYGRGLAHQRLGRADSAERDLVEARKLLPRIDEDVRKAGFPVAQ